MADIPGCSAVYRWRRSAGCRRYPGFDGYFDISTPWEDFTVKPGYTYWLNVTGLTFWTPPDP